MTASFTLPSGEKARVKGFMAVDREKLMQLPDDTLAAMAKSGELELIYAHLISMRNFAELLELRQGQQDGGQGDRQIAVGDRAAEWAVLLRPLHVDMDPLVVSGGVGETVDPVLGDLHPVADADLLIILTEWNEFRALDLERVAGAMATPRLADLRNIYSAEDAADAGFSEYVSVGR